MVGREFLVPGGVLAGDRGAGCRLWLLRGLSAGDLDTPVLIFQTQSSDFYPERTILSAAGSDL